ncbi:hypothetical protein BDC45DRAFT_529975 [Circinella umbellata]|nr:hypothetical protein BDC45DRAFT_529975 [Circinella umbellata]
MVTAVFLDSTDLNDYIVRNRMPAFEGFINKYHEKLTEYSIYTTAMSTDSYYILWRSSFVMKLQNLRPKLQLKPIKYQKQAWTANYTELARLRSASQTSTIQALNVLEASIPQAASSVITTFANTNRHQAPTNVEQTIPEEPKKDDSVFPEINAGDRLIQLFLRYNLRIL